MKPTIFSVLLLCLSVPQVGMSQADKSQVGLTPEQRQALAQMGVGAVVTLTIHAADVNHHHDEDITVDDAGVVIPNGFQLLTYNVRRVHSNEASFDVYRTTQPGYISFTSEMKSALNAAFENAMSRTTDEEAKSQLNILKVAASTSRVLDASTHASLQWRYHVEGHKYAGDGSLNVYVDYTLMRVPTEQDFAGIMLKLAALPENAKAADIAPILQALTSLLNFEGNTK